MIKKIFLLFVALLSMAIISGCSAGNNDTQKITNENLYAVATNMSSGTIVAVGENGTIVRKALTSQQWESHNVDSSIRIFSIASNNAGQFMAVGSSAKAVGYYLLASSDDGVTWNISDTAYHTVISPIIYGNNAFFFTITKSEGDIDSFLCFNSTVNLNECRFSSSVVSHAITTIAPSYGNGIYTLVELYVGYPGFYNGTLSSVDDGSTWVKSNEVSTIDLQLNYLSFGDNKFLLYGYEENEENGYKNFVMSSPDGLNWSTRKYFASTYVNFMNFGWGNFVLVGRSGLIKVSSDTGDTWTNINSGTTEDLHGVTATINPGQFVAVGKNGTIVFFSSYVNSYHGVTATESGMFIAVGDAGMIKTSTDGDIWEYQNSGVTGSLLSVVAPASIANPNLPIVAVGAGGVIITSVDNGVTWTKHASNTTNDIMSITYGNGKYVAVGTFVILYSSDGVNWTSNLSADYLLGVTYNKIWNSFYAVGLGLSGDNKVSGKVIMSNDGIEWINPKLYAANFTGITSNSITGQMVSSAIESNLFFGMVYNSLGGNNGWIRDDGLTVLPLFGVTTYPDSVRYVAVGQNGAVISSDNGINWQLESVDFTNKMLFGTAVANNTIVAVGTNNTILTIQPNRGTLNVILESSQLVRGESTNATISLNGSAKIYTPINVGLSSMNSGAVSLESSSCALTTASPSCVVNVTALADGSTNIQATSSGYTTVESALNIGPILGNLSVSLGSSTISINGGSTTATVSLVNSVGLTTPVPVTIGSTTAGVVNLSGTSCSLTSANNTCQITVTANQVGNTNIQASTTTTGYTTASSALTVAPSQGVLAVSLSSNSLSIGGATTATASLESSLGVTTGVPVTFSADPSANVSFGTYSCSLTTANNSCSVQVTALQNGTPKIIASTTTSGYTSAESTLTIATVTGTLSIALQSNIVAIDQTTNATVKLEGSRGVTSSVSVALSSTTAGKASLSKSSCLLTTASNSCTFVVTADQIGATNIKAAATGYTDVESALTIPAPGLLIYVTNGTTTGAIGKNSVDAIANADAMCNSDSAKPTSGTYKAMIMNSAQDGVFGTWVFNSYSPTNYYNISGNLIGTTSSKQLPEPLANAISTSQFNVWTGINYDTWMSSSDTCNNWTSSSYSNSGMAGLADSTSSTYLTNTAMDCSIPRHLYCVQQ